MENQTVSLALIVACIIVSAYFSATEMAFSSLNRIRVKNLAEKGDARAQLVMRLCEDYDSLLSTILIGNNIVNIAAAALTTVLFVKWLGDEMGPSASTVAMTVVLLIFGEVSPKSIAKASPERIAMLSAPLMNLVIKLFTPLNALFVQWTKFLARLVNASQDSGITEEELLYIVDEATQEGGIDEQEKIFIRRALEFTDQTVTDVLTPRVDIAAVPTTATKEAVAAVFADTAYSRLPVYQGSLDYIVGVIYHKDFYNQVYRADKELAAIVRPPLFVPPGKRIGVLLKEMQQQKIHIAVVLDEYGGTVGIVTLEDILEEMVGEIWDEYDEVSATVEPQGAGKYLVAGNTDLAKAFQTLGIKAASGAPPAGTVSGWLMNELGKIPATGDNFTYADYRITVAAMTAKRVDKVLFEKVA